MKLIPGGAAELIDLSDTGALVETPMKLAAGVPVTLCVGGSTPQRLPGRTVRCQVCAIHRDSTMTYQIAIAFDKPAAIEPLLATPPASAAVEPPPPDPALVASAVDQAELVNEW